MERVAFHWLRRLSGLEGDLVKGSEECVFRVLRVYDSGCRRGAAKEIDFLCEGCEGRATSFKDGGRRMGCGGRRVGRGPGTRSTAGAGWVVLRRSQNCRFPALSVRSGDGLCNCFRTHRSIPRDREEGLLGRGVIWKCVPLSRLHDKFGGRMRSVGWK